MNVITKNEIIEQYSDLKIYFIENKDNYFVFEGACTSKTILFIFIPLSEFSQILFEDLIHNSMLTNFDDLVNLNSAFNHMNKMKLLLLNNRLEILFEG